MLKRKQNGRNWSRRRLAIALAVVALVLVGHPALLRGVYGLLVSDVSQDPAHSDRAVLLFGDPACVRTAGELFVKGKTDGLLVLQSKKRAVEVGAVPALSDVAKSQFGSIGISADATDVLTNDGSTVYALVLALDEWTQQNKVKRVTIVCPSYLTRYLRTVIDSVIPDARAESFQLSPVVPDGFDEHRWWTNSTGIKRVGGSFVRLVHAWCLSEPHLQTARWSPEEYESWLKQITENESRNGADFAS